MQAIIAIEDYRFYEHGALDLKGTLRAFVTNQASGGVVQGGSSITQQLVKLTLLEPGRRPRRSASAATEDTYARKIQRAALRRSRSRRSYSKDWILERYLNIAYFGDGAYGIQAAAHHYFAVNASELTSPQAATARRPGEEPVGSTRPTTRRPALERRNVVLDRMAELNVHHAGEGRAGSRS